MCWVEAATLHRRLRLVDSAGATWCSQEACLAPRQQLGVAAWKDAKRRSLGPLEIAVTERDVCCHAAAAAAGHRPVLDKCSWGHRALVIVPALFYRSV
ncbi:hypothetical protein J1605_015822 [Eschrichtius robustus]|uniref:Uncharacterized protein n=1 Tax=Eschrichtius robustus TaxID=9764 RepID=A0AB34G8M6_ESCRO|nr:hypothetical protein J1605_015822 [Eschrichtius robustus]